MRHLIESESEARRIHYPPTLAQDYNYHNSTQPYYIQSKRLLLYLLRNPDSPTRDIKPPAQDSSALPQTQPLNPISTIPG